MAGVPSGQHYLQRIGGRLESSQWSEICDLLPLVKDLLACSLGD
jgi:hypothetical protein